MSWQLFDRLAAFFKSQNIYRRENLFIDQHQLDRITSGGQLINFAHKGALLEQTNLQINRLERYKDFDQMDEVGEIKLALDLYAAEASLLDPELKHAITIKAKSSRVKSELENLFYNTLMIDNQLRPIIRYLCKFGDFPAEIIPTKNRNGVMNFRFMNVYNFTRVETKYGDLVGFFFQDQHVSEPVFLHPWQVMHLRLTSFENIYHPYGRSLLDGARKHFKQLRLMEDAALIYRITRAPEKRVFTIPVGKIPTAEVEQYIESIARQFKKKQFFDPSTGDVNERWHPLIQEDDFWLPQRDDGTGPSITTLPGAENLDDIKDIEYFKKKMVAALKVPFDRVGLGEGPSSNDRSLAAVDPIFAKEVQWIQREVAVGLKKIAIIHLALAGFKGDDLRDFDIFMTASSAIDELYRIETWQSRVNVIDSLRATEMFPKKWILRRFTDMTDDEIDEMTEELKKSQGFGDDGEGIIDSGLSIPGMGGPSGELGGEKEELPAGEPVPLDIDNLVNNIEAVGGEEKGGGETPPGEGGEAPSLPEGYDVDLEKKLLIEVGKNKNLFAKLDKSIKTEKSIYAGRSHYNIGESEHINSGFDHMLNSCQLDGLGSYPDDNDIDVEKYCLVESFLKKEEIDEAIHQTKLLLTEDVNNTVFSDDNEIIDDDLPPRGVFIE